MIHQSYAAGGGGGGLEPSSGSELHRNFKLRRTNSNNNVGEVEGAVALEAGARSVISNV